MPEHAPPEYKDRAVLWNAVEKSERYKTAQLAREIELALPVEFNELQNRAIVNTYVRNNFVDKGMCADICIHDNKDGNPHAHILLTMRPLNLDGAWGAKSQTVDGQKIPTTDWNDKTKAEEWRKAWADAVNFMLERKKSDTRIDHRSYKRQGVEQIPTINLGSSAVRLERRGIRTERGNINREIEVTNQRLRTINARIRRLQNWLKTEAANTEPPTLYDIVSEILHREDRHVLPNLNEGSKVLCFIQQNKIANLQGLDKKLSDMIGARLAIGNQLKPIQRRMETLDKHFYHSDNFKKYKGYKSQYDKLYAQYKTLKKSTGFMAKRKAQKALETANSYKEAHHRELTLYNTAERYLKDALQNHFDVKRLPQIVKKWRAEYAELEVKKSPLNLEYSKLKEETCEVEAMRRSVERIISANRPQQRAREQGMEI